jgi:O-glycosyl hydrolase
MDEVCKAMISYLIYLKAHFNAEPALVSFNESDLGINILFTPQEHADFIKKLGSMMAEAGLSTKMLLCDACSPHPVHFIDVAMKDPECVKYIGAVSFHAWHDGTPEEFAYWGQAARTLKVPLLCAEGGTDADAYRYPQMFLEPWFGMYEFDTYLKILQYGQAASVLHWQLTENYSVLTGGPGGLQPTQRFFNLKQLDLTPANLSFVPLTGDSPSITHATYGDAAKGVLSVHLLNNGAARDVTLTGLPASVKELRVLVTDQTRQMKEMDKLAVSAGQVKLTLDADAYTTLMAGESP